MLTLHLRRRTSAVVIASIVRSISLLCDELAVVCEGRDTVLDRYVLSHTRNTWYRSTQNFNVYEFQCVCVSVLACVHVYPSRCLQFEDFRALRICPALVRICPARTSCDPEAAKVFGL